VIGRPTRLGALCERVVEAGWLCALVVTPLLFNVYSTSSFELDKTAGLRAIALIILLAWTIRELDGRPVVAEAPADVWRSGRSLERRTVARPWALLGLLVLATELLATVTSIAPHLSLWGSAHRHQGLYTTGAYLVVFLAILRFLRTREQAARLVTTALLASLPVSLYGIVQHAGADTVPWTGDFSGRVASTMGNPIFAGAYLIMVVPLAVFRHLESGRMVGELAGQGTRAMLVLGSMATLLLQVAAWRHGPAIGSLVALITLFIWSAEALVLRKPLVPFLRLGVYSVLLSAQLACLLLSQSRGPWLGLVAGLVFFGLLWTMSRARWRWAAVSMASGVAVVLAIVVMNVAEARFPGLREMPYAGRFTDLSETTGRVRLLIWEAAGRLIASAPSRAVAGYGPDTMGLTVLPYLSAELGQIGHRGATADRAHNEILDTLLTTGVAGLTARLLLFAALFVQGLRFLGVLRTRRDCRVFLGYGVIGSLAAPLLGRALDGSWRLAGAAFLLGAVVGIFAYLGTRAVQQLRTSETQGGLHPDASLRLLTVALLSALLAHLVEVQVGFGVAATRTYFWTYAALLAVVAHLRSEPAAPAAVPLVPALRRQDSSPPLRGASVTWLCPLGDVVAVSAVACLVLMTLLYSFLAPAVEAASLPVIIWMFGITWGVGGLLCLTDISPPLGGKLPAPRRLLAGSAYAGVTLIGTLFIGAVVVYPGVHRVGVDLTGTPLPYYTSVLLALASTAAALMIGRGASARPATLRATVATPLLATAAGALVLISCVDVVRADIYHKRAITVLGREPGRGVELARRAVAISPGRDVYQRTLGHGLIGEAMRADRAEADAHWREAEAVLTAAGQLSPLDPEHAASLGRLYGSWAEHEGDPRLKAARLRRATKWYAEATARSPHNALLWNELAAAHVRERDYVRALEVYQRSLALDDRFAGTYLHVGDLYLLQGRWEAAAAAYRQALERNPTSVHGRALLALATRVLEAVRAHERILERSPHDVVSLRALASLHHAAGDFEAALAHATRALAVAPAAERPAIQRLIDRLRTGSPPASGVEAGGSNRPDKGNDDRHNHRP
jgi:O-antigen ligase/Flp pilus assembly protein TadD